MSVHDQQFFGVGRHRADELAEILHEQGHAIAVDSVVAFVRGFRLVVEIQPVDAVLPYVFEQVVAVGAAVFDIDVLEVIETEDHQAAALAAV